MLPALFLGYVNYATAKENIIEDVNQALAKTVLCKNPNKITIDTLHVFKSNLQINQLKKHPICLYVQTNLAKYLFAVILLVSKLIVKGYI